jgi:hypothetical protein
MLLMGWARGGEGWWAAATIEVPAEALGAFTWGLWLIWVRAHSTLVVQPSASAAIPKVGAPAQSWALKLPGRFRSRDEEARRSLRGANCKLRSMLLRYRFEN